MPLHTFLKDDPPFRGLAWVALNETGHIVTGTYAQTGGGEATETRGTGSGIPCRIDALAGREGQLAGAIADRSSHLITLKAQTQVEVDDDFIVDGRGTYEITAVREYSNELTRVIEVVQV